MKLIENKVEIKQKQKEVQLFVLKSDTCEVKITNLGGIITSIKTRDRKGNLENIALGFEDVSHYMDDFYISNNPYFGAIIGRFANRIAKGRFSLNDMEYKLAINNGPNHLHGGNKGFDKKIWEARAFEIHDKAGVELSYLSPSMEEGYPGNLQLRVTYALTDADELFIDFEAETDQTTILNLTNHTYLNLNPESNNILDHELKLYAEKYTESIDLIPTGSFVNVKETPFDFTSTKKLGQDITSLVDGYDLNYILDNEKGALKKAAELSENTTGRKVELFTTQPGIQLYTGYYIPEFSFTGEKKYGRYSGVALEPQHYPDSPNNKNFPPVILKPGETYKHQTVYKFDLM
jgi:aldose 1-epimerase